MGTIEHISDEDKRGALNRMLRDHHIEGADRLRAFLTYIVEEDIAGRGQDIRGKTIAQDVYGRDTSEGTDPENVVRVDARRLRQFLELHYQGAGKTDPIRLYLDSGAYRPRYERTDSLPPETSASPLRMSLLPAATFACGAAIGAFGVMLALPPTANSPSQPLASQSGQSSSDALRRVAIYEKSPVSLQAVNLAEQARSMIFPIFDRPRQLLVLSVFEHIIVLDPYYVGGYAGAAQALASLAIIAPASPGTPDYAAAAIKRADEAIQLAPESAWSQSAKSWATFAAGDYETALVLGQRAALMDPNDSAVFDFLGAVALFSGDFEQAIETAERQLEIGSSNQRFANRNVLGAANFHIGNYEATILHFDEAAASGNPLSAPSIAYATAARAALGREREGRIKLDELREAWPEAPIEIMLKRVHVHDAYADEVLQQLVSLGWQP